MTKKFVIAVLWVQIIVTPFFGSYFSSQGVNWIIASLISIPMVFAFNLLIIIIANSFSEKNPTSNSRYVAFEPSPEETAKILEHLYANGRLSEFMFEGGEEEEEDDNDN